MTHDAAEFATQPFSGDNPCPDCKWGVCHRCGQERPDAIPGPHMGVVLCSDCFGSIISGGGG